MFDSDKIATAVITGHHEYDVVGLQTLFRSIPGVDAYPQNMEDFVTDTGMPGAGTTWSRSTTTICRRRTRSSTAG